MKRLTFFVLCFTTLFIVLLDNTLCDAFKLVKRSGSPPSSRSPSPPSPYNTRSRSNRRELTGQPRHQLAPSRLGRAQLEEHEQSTSVQPIIQKGKKPRAQRSTHFLYSSGSSGTERVSERRRKGVMSTHQHPTSSESESESSDAKSERRKRLHKNVIASTSFAKQSELKSLHESGMSSKSKEELEMVRSGRKPKVGGSRVVQYSNNSSLHQLSKSAFDRPEEKRKMIFNETLPKSDRQKHSTLSTLSKSTRSTLNPSYSSRKGKSSRRSSKQRTSSPYSSASSDNNEGGGRSTGEYSSSDYSPRKSHKIWGGLSSESSTDMEQKKKRRPLSRSQTLQPNRELPLSALSLQHSKSTHFKHVERKPSPGKSRFYVSDDHHSEHSDSE